ncbi:MAG: DinB family protein [Thermomicrobiales bacterium]
MAIALKMVRAMYGHAVWANDQLLTAAERLPPEKLDDDVPGGYGTIRETFLHLLSVQRNWLRRFQELEPIANLDPGEFPDIAAFRDRWHTLNAETETFLASLTDEALEEWIHMMFISGEAGDAYRWQAMLHLGMHQHQHRGELAAVLTTLGSSPGELDVFDYLESQE